MARCLESIDGIDLEEAHEWVRDLNPHRVSHPQRPYAAFLELYR